MADFLLVHGSCHGAWCWRDLIPALTALGHSASAIDLPGHNDSRDLTSVTLDETAKAVLAASTPETTIVGHSWAGFPISAAAELDPSMMRGLIYLCAYVPVSGLSLIEMRKRGPRQTLTGATRKDGASNSYDILPEPARELFYQDCTEEAVDFALQHLGSQPIRPQDTALTLAKNWQSTSKAYVRCTEDRVIPPEYQADMVQDWPTSRVHDLVSSHSPFLSVPQQLAALLSSIEKDL